LSTWSTTEYILKKELSSSWAGKPWPQ